MEATSVKHREAGEASSQAALAAYREVRILEDLVGKAGVRHLVDREGREAWRRVGRRVGRGIQLEG